MVSTTLTTLAAGQSSMTSSANLYHQHQQQQQQQITTATTASAANHSNYQRSTVSSSSTITTPTTTSETVGALRQSNYYNSLVLNGIPNNINNNNNNNNNIYGKNNNSLNSDSDIEHNSQIQPQQQLDIYQNYNTIFNGKTNNGANVTPPVSAAAAASKTIDETAKYETSNPYETAKPTTATTTLLNLSEALISASPPLDDQLSLLFPKCRPKYSINTEPTTTTTEAAAAASTTTKITLDHSSHITNGNDSELTADYNLLMLNDKADDGSLNVTANKKQTITTTGNRNYYQNVNIITQSPPPPSTSSVSSESLSSVTPRISTNPFLCTNGEVEEEEEELNLVYQPQRFHTQQRTLRHLLRTDEERMEIEEQGVKEKLPVPSYNSFYYHTSIADNSPTSNSMPRKRVAYNPGFHHQQQHQSAVLTSKVGVSTPTEARHCSPSNPFNSYWEPVPQTLSNGLTTGSLDDSGTELDETRTPLTSAARRTYQQQQTYGVSYNGTPNSNINNNSNRSRVPNHRRLAPSPVQRYVTQPMTQRKYDTMPVASKRSYHHSQQHYQQNQQQQQQQQLQSKVPHSEHSEEPNSGPITGRYMYDNSIAPLERYGNAMDYWEKREKTLSRDYERDRERKMTTYGEREHGDRDHDRALQHEWEEGQPSRIRNWEDERDFERERRRERFREDERQRKRDLDVRDIYEIGQKQLRQQQQQKPNYSMINNGEVVVFDDISESWQSEYYNFAFMYTYISTNIQVYGIVLRAFLVIFTFIYIV